MVRCIPQGYHVAIHVTVIFDGPHSIPPTPNPINCHCATVTFLIFCSATKYRTTAKFAHVALVSTVSNC